MKNMDNKNTTTMQSNASSAPMPQEHISNYLEKWYKLLEQKKEIEEDPQ